MRIIIANYRYFIAGGPEKYMFKFMDAARKMGVEVIPFSVDNPQNEKTPYSKYFAKPRSKQLLYADTKKSLSNLVGMVRATVWNLDAENKLCKLIRDTKPDAVYILHEVNHLSPSIIRATKKEGVRVVHRISDFFMFCPKYDFLCENEICEACLHGNYKKAIEHKCVKGSRVGTILRVFAMKLYKATKVFDDVDQYICTCEFSKNKLIEGGIPAKKITCVPTFIDSSSITPCYENDKYFLFLGRMAHQKGTIYAIEAMKYLKHTDYVLKITGQITDSPEDQEIWNYIKENELEDKIVFTGFKHGKELEELISRATCIVCPAIWYENMPNTVIEAYAYGKPVVVSRIGSLAEIVEDGKTGLLFEMKNSKDLANKLSQFISDENLSNRMGHRARVICENKYSVTKHMKAVIKILEG
ncbi:MAG: glycosyltransferase family 4 protein [Holdemanella porci]